MTGKTKYLPVIAMSLGLAFVLWYRNDKRHEANTTTDALVQTTVQQENPSPKKPSPELSQIPPAAVVDVKQWLENGPKEPIEPREIRVEAVLAPGSSATAEPLQPREIRVNAELAPGESIKTEPLIPREIKTETPLP